MPLCLGLFQRMDEAVLRNYALQALLVREVNDALMHERPVLQLLRTRR